MQLAIDNAEYPEVDKVLEMVQDMFQFTFNICKQVKHNMAQLKTIVTHLKPFGILIAKPKLTLIILANIHQAKDKEWGKEFHTAMPAIRKQYKYEHVHDATSLTGILKGTSWSR
jgi:hypothetical protein